ncbi:MAG TPA: Gfo/Idh/MocA family oxidoreductase [Roseiarcus sp.]|nr:Gfo/Idh/MocA family oxidoreductase [Roseiarcus sp.]
MKRSQSSPYRVGVIGFAHIHVNELVDRFVQCGRARIVGCADTEPRTPSRTRVEGSRHANLMRALASPGAPRAYQDYREMLDKEELDIVIMCPENARHGEVAEAAASHGAHILTEKPIAARLDEARRMAAAAREADVALAVNWPITWQPHIRRLKELIDDGAIGEVLELKWRNPASLGPLAHGSLHPGSTTIGLVSDDEKADEWWHQAAAGGGALLDYCCYGACLAAWLIPERPLSVQCLTANLMSRYGDAEDNAAMLVRFPSAIAILEGSWTTINNGVPFGPYLYGAEGAIVVAGDEILIYRDQGSEAPTAVEKGSPLPQGRSNIAEVFLHQLETGEPMHPTLETPLNLAAMAILDAGIRAAATGAATPIEQTSA